MQTDNVKNLDDKHDLLFVIFCFWSFILLCRPQDYITMLKVFHPGIVSSIIMLAIFLLNYGRITGGFPLFKIKQVKYYSWLLVVMILSIPTSVYIRVSFNMIFFVYIVNILYFFIFIKVVSSASKLRTLMFICCLGIGIYTFVALSSYSGGRLSFGTIFDPNDICCVILVFMPLNLLFIGRHNSFLVRLSCLSIIIAGVLVILLSGSRGGLVALVLTVIALFLKTKTVNTFKKIIFIIPCLTIISLAPVNYDRFSTLFNLEEDYNVHSETGRLEVWSFGIEQMIKNPFTGVGVNNFARVRGLDRASAVDAKSLAWTPPHNSLIQIGTETGFIGLFLFIMLNINVSRIFNRTLKMTTEKELVDLVTFGLAGFIGMFVSTLFISFGYSIYFVFYFAFSAVVSKIMAENSSHEFDGIV